MFSEMPVKCFQQLCSTIAAMCNAYRELSKVSLLCPWCIDSISSQKCCGETDSNPGQSNMKKNIVYIATGQCKDSRPHVL